MRFPPRSTRFIVFKFLACFLSSTPIMMNSEALASGRAYFSCGISSQIPTVIFHHGNVLRGESKVIRWRSGKIESNLKLCKRFARVLNSYMSPDSLGYLIPGYSDDKRIVICVSKTPKDRRTDETTCPEQSIIAYVRANERINNPDAALIELHRLMFVETKRGSPMDGQETSKALKYKFGGPYIDLQVIVKDSSEAD
jgi:hypothetical protein